MQKITILHFLEEEFAELCAPCGLFNNLYCELDKVPNNSPLYMVNSGKYLGSYINNKLKLDLNLRNHQSINFANYTIEYFNNIKNALEYDMSLYIIFHKQIPEPFHINMK